MSENPNPEAIEESQTTEEPQEVTAEEPAEPEIDPKISKLLQKQQFHQANLAKTVEKLSNRIEELQSSRVAAPAKEDQLSKVKAALDGETGNALESLAPGAKALLANLVSEVEQARAKGDSGSEKEALEPQPIAKPPKRSATGSRNSATRANGCRVGWKHGSTALLRPRPKPHRPQPARPEALRVNRGSSHPNLERVPDLRR